MLVQGRGRGVRAERRLAEQQLVDDAAEGVHVRGGTGGVAEGPFRCEVEARADDVPRRGEGGRGVVDELGDAEVADLDGALGVQHEVPRLDVPVDDALPMGRRQPGGRLAGDPGDLFRTQPLLRQEQVGEAPALDEFHDQEEPVLPGPEVEDGHQMRMTQPGGGLGLQPEPRGRRLVGVFAQQQLHGDGPAEDLVRGPPDLTHSATADGGYQSVPPSNQHLCTPISNSSRVSNSSGRVPLRLPRRRPRRERGTGWGHAARSGYPARELGATGRPPPRPPRP